MGTRGIPLERKTKRRGKIMLLTIPGTARIVRDMEVRYTAAGTAVVSTAIVNSRKWKDKNSGELVEEACFIDVVAFGKTGEFLNQHFAKGDVLAFVASLQQDKWEDNNGGKRSKHTLRLESVDFALTSKGDGAGHTPREPSERGTPTTTGAGAQANAPVQAQAKPENQLPEIDVNEDEIPF